MLDSIYTESSLLPPCYAYRDKVASNMQKNFDLSTGQLSEEF